MDYSWLKIDLSRILYEDVTFKLSSDRSIDSLISSIARVGLITPPILLTHENRFVIVCGFARIQACRHLGWNHITARCLDSRTSRQQCALLAVAEAVSQGPLNIVEQSRAIALLVGFFETCREDAIEAARAVGLAVNSKFAKKLSLVDTFGPQLQQGLIEETIGLPVALRIHKMFNGTEAEDLSAFFRQLRLSLTRQKEMLDWVETIIHRDGITLKELLSDPQILQWRRDRLLDDPQKSRLIRDYLKRRCYPTLSAFEQRYERTLKHTGMGKGIRFSPPPNFEGRSFSLRIDFTSHDECLERVQKTKQMVQSPGFRELLDPRYRPDD